MLAQALEVDVVAVYEDNSISAYSGRQRPGYDTLLADVEAGKLDVVIAWHPDRLHRDVEEHEQWIKLIRKTKVRIVTVLGGARDLTKAADRMVARVVAVASQYESELKSERQLSKAAEQAAAGKPNGGVRQFGYASNRRESIVESEAEIIREGARMLIAGASKGEVTRFFRDKTGRRWAQNQVMNLLNSAALASIREHHVKDPERRYVANENAGWPAILDKDTHRRLRTIIEARRGTGDHRPAEARTYLLTGIATCGKCGRTLVAQPRPNQRSYRCDQNRGCGRIRVQADPLEDFVTKAVLALAVDPDQIAKREAEADDEREIREQLAQLDMRQQNLTDLAVDGVLPQAEVRRKQRELDDARGAAESRLASLTNALAVLPGLGHMDDVRTRWAGLTLGERRQVIRSIVTKLEIKPAVPGRNKFDPYRVEMEPAWGPYLAMAPDEYFD